MIARRALLAGSAAGFGLGALPGRAGAGTGADLYADVVAYDRFGMHRTGSPGDVRTTTWIARRLAGLGYAVDRQPFACTLSEPANGRLVVDGAAYRTFPVWPPVWTTPAGISGPLAAGGRGALAVVRLPYATNGSLLVRSYREPLLSALESGADAVIGVTEGPTGEVIALNAVLSLFRPSVPVVLLGERGGDAIAEAVRAGRPARLVSTGRSIAATAANVLARRPGTGRALVISTPTSGWFTCAGERGAGIAILLKLARELPALTRRPLLFLCTSGHESEGDGSAHALATGVPAPEDVEAWFHIGANVAGAALTFDPRGRPVRGDVPVADRGTRASADLAARAAAGFAAVPGFANVGIIAPENAVGDIATYLRAGYTRATGIVGSHPLHHTELDRPWNVTTPALLTQTFEGCLRFLQSI